LIQRTVLADGAVAANMRDIVHPEIELPPPDELRSEIASGKMVLDVLIERGVPILHATTRVRPRLVEPDSRLGVAMDATRVTAAIELVELIRAAGGQAVQYSIDVFAPGSIDLHVVRGLRFEGGPAETSG
jgi:GntR family transcriptional regulator